MTKLHGITINTKKRYLILSKSPTFLNNASITIESMLNISEIYDTKYKKNTMTFNTIIFKNGGFIKFSLFNIDVIKSCNYDVLLIDRSLFASEYVTIHTYCILSDIKCIELDNDLLDKISNENDREKIPDNVEYDSYTFNIDDDCEVNYDNLSKDEILEKLKKAEIMETNKDDVFFSIVSVFGYDKCSDMSEEELNDLIKLSLYIIYRYN